MISKEEMRDFLALLGAFCTATSLSAAALAELLGISHPTMARWVLAARNAASGQAVSIRAYHHSVVPVVASIVRLNQAGHATGLYTTVKRLPCRAKLEALRAVLDAKPAT